MPSPIVNDLLQHTTALRHLARDLVGEALADDLLQETAIQAMTAPPRRPGPTGGWLSTVVRRLASKHRRAERIRRDHEQSAARRVAHFVESGAEAADTMRRLTEIVTALPEPYRSTILARYLRDRSPSDIAAETGTPLRTVKTRLARGLQLLRERFDERSGDWRAALCGAFGLEGASTAATTTAGILLMSTTMKVGLVAAVMLVAGIAAWQMAAAARFATGEAFVSASPPAPAITNATNDGPAGRALEGVAAPAPLERSPLTPKASPVVRAAADQIVVRVVDAATGTAVVSYGLREAMTPEGNLMAKEVPLLHAGDHADGRLLLPATAFEQRLFVIEDGGGRYLPSRWFGAGDAVDQDGERTIEVRMPLPIEVTLRVVHEHGGAAVTGTHVELMRPWIASPEVTLRTHAQPTAQFRAKPNEAPMVVAFSGGRALLLCKGQTDGEGCLRLLVPADELLALRLLGPGHRPAVKQPWSVQCEEPRGEVVETVAAGGAIQGRVITLDALRRLRLAPLSDASHIHPFTLSRYATGLRLRNVQTGEFRPPGVGFSFPPVALAEDGTFLVDGLTAGDWELTFCYPLLVEPEAPERPLSHTALVEVALPMIQGLAEHELRVIDIDVTGWASGHVDASMTRDGVAERSGAILLWPIAASGAPTLRTTLNLRFGENARISAALPPARYFAKWTDYQANSNVPLGEFEVRSGERTRVDFAVDVVGAQLRVVEADGVTSVSGSLTLARDGWSAAQVTDAAGLSVFPTLPPGDTLRAAFLRIIGTHADGQPQYGQPIELGTLRGLGEAPQPRVLKLPPR